MYFNYSLHLNTNYQFSMERCALATVFPQLWVGGVCELMDSDPSQRETITASSSRYSISILGTLEPKLTEVQSVWQIVP